MEKTAKLISASTFRHQLPPLPPLVQNCLHENFGNIYTIKNDNYHINNQDLVTQN